ncbi:MAG TPA: energy transducer TonB [Gammaproteobacteria bacterium]
MIPAHALRAYHDHGDRLVVSLLIAAALHALIILGISFAPQPEPQDDDLPTLDITLVPERKTAPPEEADYLAQVSQDGGGNTPEKVRLQQEQQASAAATPPPQPAPVQTREVTQSKGQRKVQVLDDEAGDKPAAPASAAELINRSLELASLDEQLRQSMQAYSQRPRQAFISARTQEFKYANYMNDWVAKVERVGNLNYPDEARRQGVSGSLMLQVSINTDGGVRNIRLLRSSGHKVLDDAAIRIVQLAAPYPPLPQEIRKDTDILHITRTWEFINNQGLSTRR